jgi:hypothetical protein
LRRETAEALGRMLLHDNAAEFYGLSG